MLLTILHCFALHKSQILVKKFFQFAIFFQISHCGHLFHSKVSVHHVAFLLIFALEIYSIFRALKNGVSNCNKYKVDGPKVRIIFMIAKYFHCCIKLMFVPVQVNIQYFTLVHNSRVSLHSEKRWVMVSELALHNWP